MYMYMYTDDVENSIHDKGFNVNNNSEKYRYKYTYEHKYIYMYEHKYTRIGERLEKFIQKIFYKQKVLRYS